MQALISEGARKLLERTYWMPEVKESHAPLQHLDKPLLDFLTLALAPPWKRSSAEQLAEHELFASVGIRSADAFLH